jgi:hypothetical protein
MAKVIYVWERRTLGLLIITWLRSSMSDRGEHNFINNYMANITYVWERRTLGSPLSDIDDFSYVIINQTKVLLSQT